MLSFFDEGMPGCLRLCARSLFNGEIRWMKYLKFGECIEIDALPLDGNANR
jgi:hypothetical protein